MKVGMIDCCWSSKKIAFCANAAAGLDYKHAVILIRWRSVNTHFHNGWLRIDMVAKGGKRTFAAAAKASARILETGHSHRGKAGGSVKVS